MSESANGTPQAVKCPACGSEHSADGRTLLQRSPRLVDLESVEKTIGKLEKTVEKLEAKLKAAEAAVTLPKKPAAAPEPAPSPPKKDGPKLEARGFHRRKG